MELVNHTLIILGLIVLGVYDMVVVSYPISIPAEAGFASCTIDFLIIENE